MPNKHAAIKYLRKTKKRNAQNTAVKTSIKSHVKAVRKAVEAGDFAKAETALLAAIKVIDKSGQNKVIKPNAASRKKSRLTRAVNKLKSAKK